MSDKIITATQLIRNFASFMQQPLNNIPLQFRYRDKVFVIKKVYKEKQESTRKVFTPDRMEFINQVHAQNQLPKIKSMTSEEIDNAVWEEYQK